MTTHQHRSTATAAGRTRATPRTAWIAFMAAAVGMAACERASSPMEPESDIAASMAFSSGMGVTGAVYTMTNAASNNEVLVYPRFADGTVGSPSAFATGGDGNGAGLGSQGAVVLSQNRSWLFAVNAGSNEISVFSTRPDGVSLRDRVPSGGPMPVSVAIHGRLVYVLNGGSPNNVTGFWPSASGTLTQIAGSSRPLSADMTGPAQVSFTNDGRTLVVTEKATNVITTFPVDLGTGLLGAPSFIDSEGGTPFGFAFDRHGRLYVSEAAGGAPGASTLSAYAHGSFATISAAVPSGESAACWVVISKDNRFAFVTNTASGSVSSYAIANDGSVSLAFAIAAVTGPGSGPIDMAISNNGRFLYVLATGNGTLRPYAINADGSLTGLGPIDGVPATAFGLAAS